MAGLVGQPMPLLEQAADQQDDEPTAGSALSQVGLPANMCHTLSVAVARNIGICQERNVNASH